MGKLVGYARVSTHEQDAGLQIDALKKEGCVRIFVEHVSGLKPKRTELEKCLQHLDRDDVLVVWRLDRLGRSLQHLLKIVEDLRERGVGFRSLCEGWLDTTTANGMLIFQLFGVLGEFERNLIVERTHAGLEAAKARGRFGGRREKLTAQEVREMAALYASKSTSTREICEKYGISRPTLYRYLKNICSAS